jgi:WD40 repeat protein
MFLPPLRRPGRTDTDVPVLGLLVVLLLLLLLGGGGVMVWQWQRMRMMEMEARNEAMRAEEMAQMAMQERERAEAEAAAARRPREVPLADRLHEGQRKSAGDALDQGLKLCSTGAIPDGLLWFVRGLEQSGDDAALQRVFRGNLAAWGGQAQTDRKLLTQKGVVTALALSPDGKTVLTGGEDKVARAWQADDGKTAAETAPAEATVTALGFGTGGKNWIVAHGARIQRYDPTGKPADEPAGEGLEAPGSVLAMTAKADGKWLMCGTCEQGIWLSEGGQRQGASKLMTPDSRVLSAALSADAKLFLTGHEDHTARHWSEDGQAIGKPLRHDAPVRAVAVRADGKLFATGAGKMVRLWDAATHLPIGRPLLHEADVVALAFAADGKSLLTGDQGGTVRRLTLSAPLQDDLRRIKLWVEVMAGKELDAAGTIRPLDEKNRRERRQKLQALGGPLTP